MVNRASDSSRMRIWATTPSNPLEPADNSMAREIKNRKQKKRMGTNYGPESNFSEGPILAHYFLSSKYLLRKKDPENSVRAES